MKSKNIELTLGKINYPIDSKARTRQQMADLLGLALRTFERELKRIKFNNGGKLITPKQQIKILKALDYL
jgi:hypothetical protein